jgi:hypothetical protein
MNVEIITVESANGDKDYVTITNEDGSFESFPVDETNPRYVQFLAEQESK